jgi:oligopeptide transport system substrate-binding protein
MDSSGSITYGVAMEYEISECATVYTFSLREDVYWADSGDFRAQCTAHDFVFAFRRLFSPAVKSRNSEDYYSILNSQAVREGKMEEDELGVSALSDFVLQIRLEQPDPDFAVLLTAPPAFPCNEEFYILTAGRYGLRGDTVPSNSGFYLREWIYDRHWTYENRIILRRVAVPETEGDLQAETIYPRGINFYVDRGAPLPLFTGGESDCIVVSGNGVEDLINRGFAYVGTETSVWGLTFNESRVFADSYLRLALAHGINREAVDFEQTGFRKTSALVPDGIKIADEFYRDLLRDTEENLDGLPLDSAKAAELFNKSAHLVDSMSRAPVLIVPAASEEDAIVSFIRSVTQQWQETFSLFCSIELLDPNEYIRRLNNGDYDMAVTKVTAGYNSPAAVLEQFAAAESESLARTAAEAAREFLLLENRILQSADFIPLCFMTEYFFRSNRSEGLVYNPFTGVIEFRDAKRF